jgi:hypothetical protein
VMNALEWEITVVRLFQGQRCCTYTKLLILRTKIIRRLQTLNRKYNDDHIEANVEDGKQRRSDDCKQRLPDS